LADDGFRGVDVAIPSSGVAESSTSQPVSAWHAGCSDKTADIHFRTGGTMYEPARPLALHGLLPHLLVTTISLFTMAGCAGDDTQSDTLSDLPAPKDATLAGDPAGPDGSEAQAQQGSEGSCSKYPSGSRTDGNGTTWWWWYFHWQSASPDLAGFCATYGSGAVMVLEVAVPPNPSAGASPASTLPPCTSDEIWQGSSRACSVANAFRFEAPCTTGEMLVELPSENTFNGYYHFESAEVPAPPRHLVNQDVHCSRDLFVTAPNSGPLVPDGGPGLDEGPGIDGV
jgi:hypothetical protein